MRETLLTTTDNPWNPATEWKEWLAFDTAKGYNTPGLLDRLTFTSPNMSEADQALALEQGQAAVLELNPFGVHTTVDVEY